MVSTKSGELQSVDGLAHVRGSQSQVDPDAVYWQHHSRVNVRTSFFSTGVAKSSLISMRKAWPTCTSIGSDECRRPPQ